MKCKKCGADLPEGGIYCSVCGERNDGKKPCPKCGKLIDENTVFCTYCGERVDGKRVCPKCGSVSDGNFCNSCGEPLEESALKNEVAATETPTQNGFKFAEIFRINGVHCLPSILSLLGLLLMAIFSFFVGINNSAEASFAKVDENMNVFYFFSEIYNQAADDGIIINKIIGSIFAGIILCVPTIVFIFALSSFLSDITKRKNTSLIKLSFVTVAVFSVSVLVLFSRSAYNNDMIASYSGIEGKGVSKLNAFCYLGMILPLIMFVFSAIAELSVENKWKNMKLEDVAMSFSGILTIILLLISVILTSRYPLMITSGDRNKITATYYYSIRGTFSTFLNSYSKQNPSAWDGCLPIAITGDFMYVAFAALFIGVVSSVINIIRKSESNYLLITTFFEIIFAIANLVCSVSFLKRFTENDTEMKYVISYPSIIAALVLAAISFTIAIICTSIKKREESY